MTPWIEITFFDGTKGIVPVDGIEYITESISGSRIVLSNRVFDVRETISEITQIIEFLLSTSSIKEN